MDFFEHQEVARKNTGRLIFLFVVAVAAIAFMIYGLVLFVVMVKLKVQYDSLWQPRIFMPCAFGTLSMIGLGSFWKIKQMGKGGAAIAERVGGRRVDPASTDPYERRILNVVEEMAVASGTPVPPVYLLDHERGINAFAAGRNVNDAVIGITEGAIEVLDRDELQGVVAHEFSHILNGDMWLNLELIGIVYGIELIGLTGRMMLQGGSSRSGSRRSGKGNGGAIGLGLALMLIGGIGSICGRLIRLGVSRQREYLADAAAVQFTRNPAGIASALKKIGGYGPGSHLGHPGRAELSHMFFGSGLPPWDLSFIFSTHPPLTERIQRIDGAFNGTFEKVPLQFVSQWRGEGAALESQAGGESIAHSIAAIAGGASHHAGASHPASASSGAGMPHPPASGSAAHSSASGVGAARTQRTHRPLITKLGDPSGSDLAHSQTVLAGLSEGLKTAARDLVDARRLAYALLLGDEPASRAKQEAAITEAEGKDGFERVMALRVELASAGSVVRVPLCAMITGTLKGLETQPYDRFKRCVIKLAEADGRMDLGEWAISGLLLHQLDGHFSKQPPARGRYNRLVGLDAELSFVLSALAHGANAGAEKVTQAFDAGCWELGVSGLSLQPIERCTPRALEGALSTLTELVLEHKKKLLGACAASIAADETVTEIESELFHVVAGWLDIPAPPLLPGQKLA